MRSLPCVLLIDLDDTILRYGEAGEGLWAEVVAHFAERLPVAPESLLASVDVVREPFWADPERSRLARRDMFAARRAIMAQAFGRLGLSPVSELVREVADAYSREREARVAPFPGALETLAELRRRGHVLGLLTNGGSPLQRAKIERHDLEADVAGAERAGIPAVWVDHGRALPPAAVQPGRCIRALADLLGRD